mgnify:CR=1 FL=1
MPASNVLNFSPHPESAFKGLVLDPDLDPTPTDSKGITEVMASERFRQHLDVANVLAQADGVTPAAARVVWIAMVHGLAVARRYACRNMKSQAARAWNQLRIRGALDKNGNRLMWDEVEVDDDLAWMFMLMRAASQ